MPQSRHWHFADYRDRGGVNKFAHILADERCADEYTARFIHDNSRVTLVPVSLKACPRYVAQVVVDDADVVTEFRRGHRGESDRGDLGICECHLGYRGVVGGRYVGPPWIVIDRSPGRTRHDHVAGSASLVLSLMG